MINMDNKQFSENILQLIGNNKVEDSISYLLNTIKGEDKELHNNVILISARYKKNENDNTIGVISNIEYLLERNKIINAILFIVKEFVRISDNGILNSKTKQAKNLKEYIQKINKLKLQNTSSFNQEYRIQDIFIQPILSDKNESNIPLSNIFDNSNRVIIHSESFTGKSTILKYIALTNVTDITVFLPLIKYEGDLNKLISEEYCIANSNINLINQNENSVFLFDAFDEILNDDLRQKLFIELQSFQNKFIVTSRSKALTKFNLPADLILKIDQYTKDEIYWLVDRMLEKTSDVLKFHNLLFTISQRETQALILKYPWFVIFTIEHFRESLVDYEFIETLPIHLLDGLGKKLASKGIAENAIEFFYIQIGKFLYDKLYQNQEEARDFDESNFDTNQKPIIDIMVSSGLLNSVSVLDKRRFYISFPFLSKALAAFYFSHLSDNELRYELKKTYCKKEFKEVIALSAAFRVDKGFNIDFYFNGQDYVCTSRGRSTNNYENLLSFIILKYLPKGYFNKPNRILQEFFDFIIKRIKLHSNDNEGYFRVMESINTEGDRWNFTHQNVLEEKLTEYLPLMLRKNDKLADTFVSFMMNELDDDSHFLLIKYTKYFVFSPKFIQSCLHAIDEQTYHYISTDSLLFSPYSFPLINKKLHKQIYSKIRYSHELFEKLPNLLRAEENYNLGIRDIRLDESDSWLIPIVLLLIHKGELDKTDIFHLLDLLSLLHFERESIKWYKKQIGSSPSVGFTEILIEYITSKVVEGINLSYVFSVILMYHESILVHEKSRRTAENIKTIINHLMNEVNSCKTEEDYSNWQKLNQTSDIFILFLNFRKLYSVKQEMENYYLSLLKVYNTNHKLLVVKSIRIVVIYLINLESEILLKTIDGKLPIRSFSLFDSSLLSNSLCKPYLVFQKDYIEKIESRIKKNYPKDYEMFLSFIGKLYEQCQEFETEESQEESFYTITKEYEKAQQIPYPRQRKEKENEILLKMCKFEEFENFIKDKSENEFAYYAQFHGIYQEKPIYVDNLIDDCNKVKYHFNCPYK